MLINELLQIIHKLFEGNTDYPDSSSEDYISRLEKAKTAIKEWEGKMKEGTFWRELFTSGTISGTGTGQDNAPGDFLYPASSIWIGASEYKFVRPEFARRAINSASGKKFYWFTGGRGAYKLHTYPAISGNFDIDYYKESATYVDGSETTPIEMSDPYYVIFMVLSQLFFDDENSAQASYYMDLANEKMDAMELNNENTPFYQSNLIDDLSDPGFGV